MNWKRWQRKWVIGHEAGGVEAVSCQSAETTAEILAYHVLSRKRLERLLEQKQVHLRLPLPDVLAGLGLVRAHPAVRHCLAAHAAHAIPADRAAGQGLKRRNANKNRRGVMPRRHQSFGPRPVARRGLPA